MNEEASNAKRRPAGAASQPSPALRERLLIVVSLVACAVAVVAAASYVLIVRAEANALAVYETRVLPTSALRTISDSYAIDIVDTIHKVSSGRLDISEGARRVKRALAVSDASWRVYARRSTSPEAVRETERLLVVARAEAMKAQDLMLAANFDALEQFRTRRMYVVVEPLTQRLAQRVAYEVAQTDALVTETRTELRRLRVGTSIVLFAVALAGWAYVARFSRKLARSISGMEFVVRRVADGDLSPRAKDQVDEAFADMAADIDSMIDALEHSRRALESHAGQLEQAAQRAHTANAAKTLFLSSMSHELRTPLNVILGYAQILARDSERPEQDQRALTRILRAGTHLLRLIDDVLSIAKIEAGTLALRAEPFNVHALADDIRGMFAARASGKSLALNVVTDASVPEWLFADAGRLRQVLVNLVNNAVKFTDHGQIDVRLWYTPDRLRASVTDTGRGISSDELGRLFERFYQGSAGQRSVEGTGLGLYISRSLVRLMGGELTATSVLELGSTFSFDILAPPTAAGTAPASARQLRVEPGMAQTAMLVVDDREDNREVLSHLLCELGFRVDEARDANEAITACAERPYALVWMDLHMPGMTGVQAMQRIRERDAAEGQARRAIVAVTASVIDLDREAARRQGFDDLIGKPFQDHAITALIGTLLGVRFVDETSGSGPQRISLHSASELGQMHAMIADLPHAVRDDLLSALVAGDAALARDVLGRVEPRALSDAMRAAVDSYAYDALIAELRSVSSPGFRTVSSPAGVGKA